MDDYLFSSTGAISNAWSYSTGTLYWTYIDELLSYLHHLPKVSIYSRFPYTCSRLARYSFSPSSPSAMPPANTSKAPSMNIPLLRTRIVVLFLMMLASLIAGSRCVKMFQKYIPSTPFANASAADDTRLEGMRRHKNGSMLLHLQASRLPSSTTVCLHHSPTAPSDADSTQTFRPPLSPLSYQLRYSVLYPPTSSSAFYKTNTGFSPPPS